MSATWSVRAITDFRSLGYEGDPIIYGGRFKRLPMGYKAKQYYKMIGPENFLAGFPALCFEQSAAFAADPAAELLATVRRATAL